MLQDKIRLGISLLDRVNPDWHWRVNTKALEMEYDQCCVLGQLYRSYEKGKVKLNLTDEQAYQAGFLSWFQRGYDWSQWLPFVGRRLTKAWKKAILNKREADAFEQKTSSISGGRGIDKVIWNTQE